MSATEQATSPGPTDSPGATRTSLTVPAFSALTLFSIFMASSTHTVCPTSTVSPAATRTLTIVPCIGTATVPEPPPAAAALGRFGPAPRGPAPPACTATASPRSGTHSFTW